MAELPIKEISEKLLAAGRLKHWPLCVYGADTIPEGAVKASSIDRCIAKVAFMLASSEAPPAVYVSGEDEDVCMGGRTWLGYTRMHPQLKFFVTTGTKEFRGGAAEHLKATPEHFEKSFRALGKITPPGKYIIIIRCSDVQEDPGVRSILCFGGGEQVRNLAALAHFTEVERFTAALVPWGPSCATFITYPAGMAEKAPKNAVFLGPVDPTGNIWFPPELMAMGIPLSKAGQMAESLGESFIVKKPRVAYPERRIEPKIEKE